MAGYRGNWPPEEQVPLRPEFENGGRPAGVLDPVIDGVPDSALLVAEVRLHDRCQAAELSPDDLPASGRGAGRLAGKISNAGQDACDHLMVFSQLPHDIPEDRARTRSSSANKPAFSPC